MTKQVLYTYLGTNGVITSPVHLEDIYYTRRYRLIASKDKQLTRDGEHYVTSVIVDEDDVDNWEEVTFLKFGQT